MPTIAEVQVQQATIRIASVLERIADRLDKAFPDPAPLVEPDELGSTLDLITACKEAANGGSNDNQIEMLQETVEALIGFLPGAAKVAAQDRWDNYDPDDNE